MEKRTVDALLKRLTKQITSDSLPKPNRLMITLNFDLRGIKNKQDVMNQTPLCTGWMVFINHRGTLAHVMHADDVDDYNRVKLAHSLKNANEDYIRKVLYERMKTRYIF